MKPYPVIFVAGVLFASVATAQTAVDYYPLAVGNYWVYTTTLTSGKNHKPIRVQTIKSEIDDFGNFKDRMAYRMKNTVLEGNDAGSSSSYGWFRVEAGSIFSIALGASPDLVLVEWDPPIKLLSADAGTVGASWTNKMTMHHSDYPDSTIVQWWKYVVLGNSATVRVPAGTFEKCLSVCDTLASYQKEPSLIDHWYFAPNVGEVLRVQEKSDGSVYRSELIEYRIGMK